MVFVYAHQHVLVEIITHRRWVLFMKTCLAFSKKKSLLQVLYVFECIFSPWNTMISTLYMLLILFVSNNYDICVYVDNNKDLFHHIVGRLNSQLF